MRNKQTNNQFKKKKSELTDKYFGSRIVDANRLEYCGTVVCHLHFASLRALQNLVHAFGAQR